MKKAKLLLAVLVGVLAMGSACTKSCKNTPSSTSTATNTGLGDSNPHAEPTTDHKDEEVSNKEKEKLMNDFNLKPGDKLIADIDTSEGHIKAELFWELAPRTVENFVSLALGKKEWTNPSTHEKSSKPLYNGTIFHRVIKGFMIQGGDPAGNGTGGPGYKFKDEFNPTLKHDKKGVFSMANSGPNTNGSQFFITEVATPHLNNRHSVFGQAVGDESFVTIDKIAGTPTGKNDMPLKEVRINMIEIQKQ